MSAILTKLILRLLLMGIVLLPTFWLLTHKQETAKNDKPKVYKKQPSIDYFDKASSIWAVVNKGRTLPSNYQPVDLVIPDVSLRDSSHNENMLLRKSAAQALERLVSMAKSQNLQLKLASGYRAYKTQQRVYQGIASVHGVEYADSVSARPGFSEHQTGLAADLMTTGGKCELDKCFSDLPEGRWLTAHVFEFGFIIRYPLGKENETGYDFEPWHIRYVGPRIAAELNQSGDTLEQYYSLPAYQAYPINSFLLH